MLCTSVDETQSIMCGVQVLLRVTPTQLWRDSQSHCGAAEGTRIMRNGGPELLGVYLRGSGRILDSHCGGSCVD